MIYLVQKGLKMCFEFIAEVTVIWNQSRKTNISNSRVYHYFVKCLSCKKWLSMVDEGMVYLVSFNDELWLNFSFVESLCNSFINSYGLKDLTTTLAAWSVEKHLVHYIIFKGIMCYFSQDTKCTNCIRLV